MSAHSTLLRGTTTLRVHDARSTHACTVCTTHANMASATSHAVRHLGNITSNKHSTLTGRPVSTPTKACPCKPPTSNGQCGDYTLHMPPCTHACRRGPRVSRGRLRLASHRTHRTHKPFTPFSLSPNQPLRPCSLPTMCSCSRRTALFCLLHHRPQRRA